MQVGGRQAVTRTDARARAHSLNHNRSILLLPSVGYHERHPSVAPLPRGVVGLKPARHSDSRHALRARLVEQVLSGEGQSLQGVTRGHAHLPSCRPGSRKSREPEQSEDACLDCAVFICGTVHMSGTVCVEVIRDVQDLIRSTNSGSAAQQAQSFPLSFFDIIRQIFSSAEQRQLCLLSATIEQNVAGHHKPALLGSSCMLTKPVGARHSYSPAASRMSVS